MIEESGRKEKTVIPGIPDWFSIFILALTINAAVAYTLLNFFEINMYPDYYHILAQNLLNGNGYNVEPGTDGIFWRPPLYPLFLAAIYYVFGVQHLPVVFAQVLINSLTSVIVFKLMKKVFSPATGMYSAIIYALYPLSAYYVVRELPLILFNFLLIFLILIMYRLYEVPNLINAFLFGAVQGFLTLTKVVFKGFPAFVILGVLLISVFRLYRFANARNALINPGKGSSHSLFDMLRSYISQSEIDIKKYAQAALLMFIGFSVILMPWLIRNYKISGVFPVVGVGGGFTLWIGNHIETDGTGKDDITELPPEMFKKLKEEKIRIIGEGTVVDLKNDKKMYNEAFRNFIRYPGATTVLLFKKMFRLWFWVFTSSMQKYQVVVTAIQLTLIVPAILGIFLSLRKGIRVGPLLILLAYFQIVYTIFISTLRYSTPVMPVVIGFAVYGINEIYRGLLSGQHRETVA